MFKKLIVDSLDICLTIAIISLLAFLAFSVIGN